jgi:hypothetical protein
MVTVFFNGIGAFFVNFLLKGQKMNGTDSAQEILHPLSAVCYPDGPEIVQQ